MKSEFIHSLKLFNFYIGFGILMFVTVKAVVFWVVTPSSLERAQATLGKYDHLQDQIVSQRRNEQKQVQTWLSSPLKHLAVTKLHDIKPQKASNFCVVIL
jgi:uncharacterized protein YfaQ (DUF2300 family)